MQEVKDILRVREQARGLMSNFLKKKRKLTKHLNF